MALSQLQKRLFASSIAQRKVAPSAWFYLANYNIDAAKVQATGPRGHLTKEDLLLFIAKNNLQKVEIKAQAPAKQTQTKRPASPRPAAATGKREESPKYDINKPFQQTWRDKTVEGDALTQAENIHAAKRYVAHTYLTTKIDTHCLFETFGSEASVEHFLRKAVSKAFQSVTGHNADINGTSEHAVGLSSVSDSLEALPICVPPTLMSVHHTPVITEVALKDNLLVDIDSEELAEEEATVSASDLRLRKTVRISVTYDI